MHLAKRIEKTIRDFAEDLIALLNDNVRQRALEDLQAKLSKTSKPKIKKGATTAVKPVELKQLSPLDTSVLAALKAPMGSAQLARRLSKPAPSVRRSLAVLQRAGFVKRNSGLYERV